MARNGQAFQSRSAPENVTERIRRVLSHADTASEPVQRLIAAAERLKLKPVAPFYLRDCWARIGFEKLKVAVYTDANLENHRVIPERKLWEAHGWHMLAIAHRQIASMSDESLTAQLKAALVELGKLK